MNPFINIKNNLKSRIPKTFIISIIIPIMVSSFVTFYLNNKLDQKTASREFIYNFSRVFFDNPKYRNISIALENSYLYGETPVLEENGGQFSDYEIDDYLSLIYDLYAYGEEGLVPYRIIDDQFHYHICITYNNEEIKEYRNRLKREGFSDESAYSYFDDFASKLKIEDGDDCKYDI